MNNTGGICYYSNDHSKVANVVNPINSYYLLLHHIILDITLDIHALNLHTIHTFSINLFCLIPYNNK